MFEVESRLVRDFISVTKRQQEVRLSHTISRCSRGTVCTFQSSRYFRCSWSASAWNASSTLSGTCVSTRGKALCELSASPGALSELTKGLPRALNVSQTAQGLMHSCKQVRNEFMPLYIASTSFLLHLGYDEGKTGLETLDWLAEADPVLTSRVPRLSLPRGSALTGS
jgi:hypothetical protein